MIKLAVLYPRAVALAFSAALLMLASRAAS
jgi:hypothetical protein